MATKEENITAIKTLLADNFDQDVGALDNTTKLNTIIAGKEALFIEKLKEVHDVDVSENELNAVETIEDAVTLLK